MLRGVVTDIDGTLTDEKRRLSTAAIETIRKLQEGGIEVVLASGNTSCLLKGLSKLIGTGGSFIGENGGVYRVGYTGELRVLADRKVAIEALNLVTDHYHARGMDLELYSPHERFADVAFARTVPIDEVRTLLAHLPVTVFDTRFAIHLQQAGFDKGITFLQICRELGIPPADFVGIGDSDNDIGLISQAGQGCCVANANESLRSVAGYIAERPYGEGFVEVMNHFFPVLTR